MNKFYILFFLSSTLYCSSESGKLPSDFKFKEPKEYVEEVSEKRSSFMSQWKEYEESKVEKEVEKPQAKDKK